MQPRLVCTPYASAKHYSFSVVGDRDTREPPTKPHAKVSLELETRMETQTDVNGINLSLVQSNFSPSFEETAAVLSASAPLEAVLAATGL